MKKKYSLETDLLDRIEELEAQRALLLEACKSTLDALENMTTEAFSLGADKINREELQAAIAAVDGGTP